MRISSKLTCGIAALAFVLAALTVYSQVNIGNTTAEIEDIDRYRELQSTIAPRIIDHLKWAEALAVGTMLFGEPFTGQLDHRKCTFGLWYYAHKPPKETEETFAKLEQPHQALHATAWRPPAATCDQVEMQEISTELTSTSTMVPVPPSTVQRCAEGGLDAAETPT